MKRQTLADVENRAWLTFRPILLSAKSDVLEVSQKI